MTGELALRPGADPLEDEMWARALARFAATGRQDVPIAIPDLQQAIDAMTRMCAVSCPLCGEDITEPQPGLVARGLLVCHQACLDRLPNRHDPQE